MQGQSFAKLSRQTILNSFYFGRTHAVTGMRWDLGRSDIFDHRQTLTEGQDPNLNLQTGPVFYNRPRLPIGYVSMTTKSPITNADLRLSLYDGILTGTLETDSGTVSICTFVHAEHMAIVVEANVTKSEAVEFNLVPLQGDATRPCLKSHGCDKYIPNPPVVHHAPSAGVQTTYQKLNAGGGYATAMMTSADQSNVVLVAIEKDYTESDSSVEKALKSVSKSFCHSWGSSFVHVHVYLCT